jgi:signal recognition particle subunit SRP54
MLESLTQGFTAARERLSGVRELTPENIDESLREVRRSLLEADVDLGIVRGFLERVKERALGTKVETRVRSAAGQLLRVGPGQHFVKACQDELTALMGPVDPTLARDERRCTSVMLLGLQGVGKTTVAGKLARHLQKQGRRPLLVAADVQRPAAVMQLQQLGLRLGVTVHSGAPGARAPEICADAAARAVREGYDAIIYDTAGRLAIDAELMAELAEIETRTQPANKLLVCDALMGRDSVNVAKSFHEALSVDGVILTKLDGDARGGAALAVKAATGVPIKFIGTGETLERLEEFRPEGLASRILGMGDVVGLVRDFEEVVDQKEAEADAARLLAGRFGLDDLLKQLRMIQRMGPFKDLLAKLPMMGGLADQVDESGLTKIESMIHSMTPAERKRPELIDKSRAARIARGCGRRSKDVRELVERFDQMRGLMQGLGSPGGLLGRIPGFGRFAGAGAAGGMPAFDPAMLGAGGGIRASKKQVERQRAQQKNKRKQARKARKKNRKR